MECHETRISGTRYCVSPVIGQATRHLQTVNRKNDVVPIAWLRYDLKRIPVEIKGGKHEYGDKIDARCSVDNTCDRTCR